MPPDLTGFDNPFADFLGSEFLEQPGVGMQSAFFSQRPQGLSPNLSRLFESSFGRFQNQFLGSLGQQILGGENPTARFVPFLQERNILDELRALPPGIRGGFGTSQFAPQTSFLNF
jgi:hypothetical protein